MNGLEFIGKVKEDERLQLIPVVVMTTSSLNSDVRSAYKQLANAVVVKPIEFELHKDDYCDSYVLVEHSKNCTL